MYHAGMRLQLALNVKDLDEGIDFYSKMFDTAPAKIKPGYANFEVANPPLKLVLFENPQAEGDFQHLNHLGVETEHSDQVVDAEARLSASGLETTGVDDTICCFAEKVETWVNSPEGARWEWYVKQGDSDQLSNEVLGEHESAGTVCCATPTEPSCC